MTGKANVDPLTGCNPRALPVIAVDGLLMIVVVIVDHVSRSVVGKKLSLVLSGEGLEEGGDLVYLS